MTRRQTKAKNKGRVIPLREAGATVAPPLRPSVRLFAEAKEQIAQEEQQAKKSEVTATGESLTLPSQTRQTRQGIKTKTSTLPSQTRQSHQLPVSESPAITRTEEIAPIRDFQKVPNSVTKNAIPEGFFKPGKSKQLYDVLYGLTRGAMEPKREVRLSKSKLMKLAGIGSRITFDSIIAHFIAVGLIRVAVVPGEHQGNSFEVFTYEEIQTLSSLSSQSSQTTQTSPAQNLDRLLRLETRQTRQGLNDDSIDGSASLKTFLKTVNLIDDENALLTALEKLNQAAVTVTGRNLTPKDWEAFGEIIDLIIHETNEAVSRTKSVSVYLKLAAENLRRRLLPLKTLTTRERSGDHGKGSKVGKSPARAEEYDEAGNYLPRPLTTTEKEQTLIELQTLRESGIPIEDLAKWYTSEDWQWLENQVEKSE